MDISLLPRGAFPVTLDRERVIFYDMAATWALIQRYGMHFMLSLYVPHGDNSIELASMDALKGFLFVGLQKDARDHGETLTEEQVGGFIHSWNYAELTKRIVYALIGNVATPAILGEMTAVGPTGKPAAKATPAPLTPGPTLASTSTKRSASRTPTSAGHRKGSGRSPSGSSTLPAKAISRRKK